MMRMGYAALESMPQEYQIFHGFGVFQIQSILPVFPDSYRVEPDDRTYAQLCNFVRFAV